MERGSISHLFHFVFFFIFILWVQLVQKTIKKRIGLPVYKKTQLIYNQLLNFLLINLVLPATPEFI